MYSIINQFSIAIIIFFNVILFNASAQPGLSAPDTAFTNPVWDGADPWFFRKAGYYYYCYSSGNSIYISKSEYLSVKNESKKIWTAPKAGWNCSNIWAPELHFFNGKWYIYYAAGSSGPPYINQRAGVLESLSDNALGEYLDKGILITSDAPYDIKSNIWAIDLTVFNLNDKLYAVWSGWEKNEISDKTPQALYIAPMSNPYTISGKRVKISSPTEYWETGGPLNLNEGPEILENDTNLFIIYSCRESWTKDYKLGQLRLRSLRCNPLSPESWIKSGPVFKGTNDVYGVGHASFTKSPDGKEDWIIYHSKKTTTPNWDRDVRMQKFDWNKNGSPRFGKPISAGIEIKKPSGENE